VRQFAQSPMTSHVPHLKESYPTSAWVMSHTQVSHVPYTCGNPHNCPWRVMSHFWKSHVPHLHESCLTSEWVMSRVCVAIRIIAYDESCSTFWWVMSNTRMSHVLHPSESCPTLNESCRTPEWVMSIVARIHAYICIAQCAQVADVYWHVCKC